MSALIVVESAGKQRIVSDLVRKSGLDYLVVSCSGHYCGLPKSQLGIDQRTLEFTWKVRNMQAFERMKKAVADADAVYAATDLSPEGEAIANQISITAGYGSKPFYRLRLSELHPDALRLALSAAGPIDSKVLQAYLAREAVDRISRFTLSPVLEERLGEGLQFGLAAFPLLSELARTERKIRRFVPETIHVVRVLLADGSTAESLPLPQEEATALSDKAKAAVPAFTRAKELNFAEPPFTLSTLIQFASKRYGISALACIQACDSLFEMGLITYPYTDSTWLSTDFLKALRTFISEKVSSAFLHKETFTSPSSMEAIRPVSASHFPSQLDLSGDLKTLYSAIWFRTAGSQGRPSQLERQMCSYSIQDKEVFKAEGLVIVDSGWHQLSGRLFEPTVRLLEADSAVVDSSVIQTTTKGPKRHTYGSLVAWLDEHLIGKPKTYRPILEFLQHNSYIEVLGGGLLRITPKGETVLTFIRRVSPDILDPDFCAELEEELSALEQGSRSFEQLVRDHWSWTTEISERMSKKSLRPDFTAPSGNKLRVFINKESGRPFVKDSDEWWSHVAFDAKGKMILTDDSLTTS